MTSETSNVERLLERMQLDPVTQELRPAWGGQQLAADVVDLESAEGVPVDRGRLTREQKQAISDASLKAPKPPWLKVRLPGGGRYAEVASVVREQGLHTICQEGHCPNIGECWGKGTATFQVLGDMCTRACRYCAVATGIPGTPPDPLEPGKLAHAINEMGISHAVITSVDRDDLDDAGAGHWAQVIEVVRRRCPDTTIEVLVPDFMGCEEAGLQSVVGARPDVYSHNVETVRRLYPRLRPKGSYDRAMWVLERSKQVAREHGQEPLMTKTGLIAGMGESIEELKETLRDVRATGVDVVTIGQYLRPTRKHVPVDRYVTPAEFDELRDYGLSLGFGSVFAGPLVRSSYKAEEQRFAALDPTVGGPSIAGAAPVVSDIERATIGVVPAWKQDSTEDR